MLVVEDDVRWRERLDKQIRRVCESVDIQFANNFDQAMDAFDSEQVWDLITLDIGMPFDDEDDTEEERPYGMQIAERAGQEQRRYIVVSGTPITPSHAVEDLKETHGARRFFSKFHLDFERFGACVRELLAESESHRANTGTNSGHVTISSGVDCFIIKTDGKPDFAVPAELSAFVALYAQKVGSGGPCESLRWRDLNTAVEPSVAEADGAKSSDRLRKALSKLNSDLEKQLGMPPDGAKWFVTVRGYGAHLNKSIQWSIDDRARSALRSVYAVNVDPHTMEQTTPNPGDRLPAQPKRKPPARDEE